MKFTDGEEFELNKGDFLPFDARKEHNVIARVTSKVLVTIIVTSIIKSTFLVYSKFISFARFMNEKCWQFVTVQPSIHYIHKTCQQFLYIKK